MESEIIPITLELSDEEYELIQSAAELQGITMEEFCRRSDAEDTGLA